MEAFNFTRPKGQISSKADVIFYVGMQAQALRGTKWYPIKILNVNPEGREVLCQYENSTAFGEWINVDSCRIRPVTAESLMAVAQEYEAKTEHTANGPSNSTYISPNWLGHKSVEINVERSIPDSLGVLLSAIDQIEVNRKTDSPVVPSSAADQVQIKIQRDIVDSADFQSSMKCTYSYDSTYAVSNIVIKDEKDLGVVDETLVNNQSVIGDDGEDYDFDDELATLAYEASENSKWDPDVEDHCRSVSPNVKKLLTEWQKFKTSARKCHKTYTELPTRFLRESANIGAVGSCTKHPPGEFICHSTCFKLKEVKIILEDFFPRSQLDGRRSGSHINSPNCQCIFCTRKFKFKENGGNILKQMEAMRSTESKKKKWPSIRSALESKRSPVFSCMYCFANFPHKNSLQCHLRMHSDGRHFKCPYCPLDFNVEQSLRRHLVVHTDARPFSCTFCPAKFKRKDILIDHQRTHTGEKRHYCTFCPAKFNRRKNFEAHLMTHNSEKPFECTHSVTKFCQNTQSKHHLKIPTTVNQNIETTKPLVCQHCSAEFREVNDLYQHSRIHFDQISSNVRLHKCTFCPSKFSTKRQLKMHHATHSNEKAFGCALCPAKFSRSNLLKSHLKIHTGKNPYPCSDCPAQFKEHSEWVSHRATCIHTHKPLSCTFCPAKFNSESNLEIHSRTHTNEGRFMCAYCTATFVRSGDLKTHIIRYHTGTKPFTCILCPAAFNQGVDLIRHRSTHTETKS